jgi:superoxide reductase
MNIFICGVCGHVEFNRVPDSCPVCSSAKDKYSQKDNVFIESEEKSKEAAVKHIPSIKINKECNLIKEQTCYDIIVRIGEVLHPMVDNHHIQFIDCYVDDNYLSRILLTYNVFAAGCFHLNTSGSRVRIVESCNLHGYWQTEINL